MSRPQNKENLQALADQVVWAIQTYVGGGVENIPQVMGTLYYVSTTDGSDANTGLSPAQAKATIQAAIDAGTDGDILIVEAGIYDEPVVMDENQMEIHCEVGTTLMDTATGVQTLLISGSSCLVDGLTIIQAGQVGVKVTNSACYLNNVTVAASTIGFDIDGASTTLERCTSGSHSVTSFDLSSATNRLIDCWSRGVGATRGFYLSHADADGCLLENCVSAGNTVAGFEVVTGVSGGIFKDCTSGASDGVRLDPDKNNVWDDYAFDDKTYKLITFAGVPTTYNIFTITGAVSIKGLYGHVETQIANTASAMHLEVYSAGGTSVLTKVAGAPDIDSLVVGSLLSKIDAAGVILSMSSAATPTVVESTASSPDAQIIIVADDDQTTYIRSNMTAALASGAIHWHVEWEPLTDNGNVVPS